MPVFNNQSTGESKESLHKYAANRGEWVGPMRWKWNKVVVAQIGGKPFPSQGILTCIIARLCMTVHREFGGDVGRNPFQLEKQALRDYKKYGLVLVSTGIEKLVPQSRWQP